MPTSRSPKRSVKPPLPPQRSRFILPLILIVVVALLIVVVAVLPASMVRRVLPPSIHAEDFSGTVWHGSAGKITVDGRDAGAIEWRLHPWYLLSLTLSADAHWVLVGFVADASVAIDRHGLSAKNVTGGGPIEDLGTVGIAAGWHGLSHFKLSELELKFTDASVDVQSAAGELDVSNLSSPKVAAGADLGAYALTVANGAVTPDGATAQLTDTGGPLQVQAEIRISAKERSGLLSGTVKERPDASPALRAQLDQLAQLHARDSQGRLPVDLEVTL
jgi:hypothetical protein